MQPPKRYAPQLGAPDQSALQSLSSAAVFAAACGAYALGLWIVWWHVFIIVITLALTVLGVIGGFLDGKQKPFLARLRMAGAYSLAGLWTGILYFSASDLF